MADADDPMQKAVVNPMSFTDDVDPEDGAGALTKLGDEPVGKKTPKGRPVTIRTGRTRSRGASDDDDDGGEETLEHFLDDAFEHWVADDKPPMTLEQLSEWSETVLGVEMADDEMKLIYQHIIEADQSSSRAKGVTMNALKAWWISDTGVAHDDECDFRRALRLRGVFTACKSSLLNLADPTASHLATRQLFQRINVVCDYHQEGRDRVTMDNLKVLCEDLGIEVDQQQLKRAVNEMDSTKMGNVFVGFHPFEEWWLHGAGMERDAEVSDSTVVHSMLRLCGLLMCAEQATVFGVWNSATSILSNEEMRQSVEKALDKISKNADHHHFDTMIERLHLASLGGMLHKEDTVELEGSSLGIFDTDHPLRQFCVKVVTSVEFELFILTCIFINILALTLFAETKTSALTEEDADVGVSTFFQVVNLTVAVIFTLEMIARIIAFGFVVGKNAYVRNGWNVFDGVIVLSIWTIGILSLATNVSENIAFILTALRAFRSFRFFEGTRQIVQTFVKAKETLGLVCALMVVLFIMFAIIGREVFAGALTRSCEPFLDEIPVWTAGSWTDIDTVQSKTIDCAKADDSHRRQLAGGATKGDLRDMYSVADEFAKNYWSVDNGTLVAGYVKPWFTEKVADVCPLTLSCATATTQTCWEATPKPGPKWREHHIDKYGFDSLNTAFLTIFQVTARDEWMRLANPIFESKISTSWAAWAFFAIVFVVMSLMSINLFLASITLSYLDLQKELRQEKAIQSAHEALIAALLSQGGGTEAASILTSDNADDDELSAKTGCGAWCQDLITGPSGMRFDTAILIVVTLNTVAMGVEHHEMDADLATFLYVLEAIFTCVYVFECIVKIAGLGFQRYISSNLNRLDFFIVVTALLGYAFEIFLYLQDDDEGDAANASALRMLRIFRVIRAARAMRVGKILVRSRAISQIIGMAFASWSAILSLLFMIFLTMAVASLSGIFLFASCHETGDQPVFTRGNYGTLAHAFLANFQLFTEDNWANIMFEYEECMETKSVALYFSALFTVLDFLLLVVFVSIFLDNFTLSEEGKRKKQVDLYVKAQKTDTKVGMTIMDLKSVNMAVRLVYSGGSSVMGFLRTKNLTLDEGWNPTRQLDDDVVDSILEHDKQIRAFAEKAVYGQTIQMPPLTQAELNHMQAVGGEELGLRVTELGTDPPFLIGDEANEPKNDNDPLDKFVNNGVTLKMVVRNDIALGCMPPEHGFRMGCKALVENTIFETFILLCIAASGIALAIEGPTNHRHDDTTEFLLQTSDLLFYLAFLVECLGKIAAYGFLHTPNAYLSSTSNIFDFSVVLITSVDLVLWIADVDAAWITIFRLMRSLRLVRLVERVEGLNVMARAIWSSLPACAAIGGLLIGNMLMFSIVGMNLFQGQMWYCKGHKELDRKCPDSGCVPGVEYCDVHYPGKWQKQAFGYDNIFDSLSSLVVLTTRQGWHELFFYATDITDVDMAPEKDDNLFVASAFFVTFIVINGFMLEELFIGMLVEIFSQTSGTVLLTETQKKWRYLQMYVYHFSETHPDPPPQGLRRTCYEMTTHEKSWFQKGMIAVVCANVLILIYDDSAHIRRTEGRVALDYVNDFCVFIFTVEIVVDVLAFGSFYLKKNLPNVLVIAGLWVVCIHAHLQHSGDIIGGSTDWIQVFQCLRVIKLFEVLSHFSKLKKLVHTLRLALPQAVNIIMLMTMSYFLFGIIAMKLYGDIEFDSGCKQLHWIGETNNFRTIWHSMRLLFQITTGNPLPLMIEDLRHEASLPATIMPFIFIFFVISNFVLLNVFIALLLENFEYNLEGEFAIEEVEVDRFKEDWDSSDLVERDTDSKRGVAKLSLRNMNEFMMKLTGPLSVVVDTDPFWYNRLLLELDVDYADEMSDDPKLFEFHEVMLALCKMRFGNSCLPFDLEIQAEERQKQRHEETAARLIQVCYSSYRMEKNGPPPGIATNDEDVRRWRIMVRVARMWVLTVAIAKMRISASRFKTAKELQASKTRVARGGEKLKNMKWGTAPASKLLTAEGVISEERRSSRSPMSME